MRAERADLPASEVRGADQETMEQALWDELNSLIGSVRHLTELAEYLTDKVEDIEKIVRRNGDE